MAEAFVPDTFNPLSDLFVAQFAKPEQLGDVNLRALTPFTRALLTIDGTVTKFIEAYAMEPVEVVTLGQAMQQLSAAHEWLEVPEGEHVIARHVLLRGRYSRTFHAYAASLIVPNRLPDPVRRELEAAGETIGRIFLNNRMESYREVLWYGREQNEELPQDIRHLANGGLVSRTYRIIVGRQPVMLITEKFPLGGDTVPSHH